MLQTSDGGVVLLRRSNEVALFGGVYNGPSGHPEPALSEAIDAAAAAVAAPDRSRLRGKDPRRDISLGTGGVRRDRVPLTALSHPRLIGSMVDADAKPDLLLTKTTLTAAEVAQTVRRGGASEAWESNAFAAVSATPPSDVEERSTAAVEARRRRRRERRRRGCSRVMLLVWARELRYLERRQEQGRGGCLVLFRILGGRDGGCAARLR